MAAQPALGTPGWWRDRVFYEVFVRSFADSNGDGAGDLRGLIGRLDYLNDADPSTTTDLGVTGLWLMPIFPSPSYHGYDVTDYRGVNPDYGSLADLRILVGEAHRRGIAVILDMPLNHTSDRDPWFVASRTKPDGPRGDWYVWANEPGGSNWHADGSRYFYGAFGADLPDLNLANPAVTAEVEDVARFWLDDVGIDGFRLDAAKHLIEDSTTTENTPETHAWLHDFRASVESRAPGALLLGEVWDPSPVSASYVPEALDMTFEFGLSSAYLSAVEDGRASAVAGPLAKITSLYPIGGFGAFLTNHDMDRVASQLGGDTARLRLAAGLLLTGPGVPFVYYGEELGMTGSKPDPRIRTPMRWDASTPAAGFSTGTPWEELSADPPEMSVAAQTGDPGSLLSTYRALIRARAAEPALALGDLTPVDSSDPAVLAVLRRTPDQTLLVVANLSGQPVSGYALKSGSAGLCGFGGARLAFSTDAATAGGSTPAPPTVAGGGFASYAPIATLPARSVSVIAFGP